MIHRRGVGGIDPITLMFEQRAAAAHADHEAAAAEMVEHADFFVKPQRVIQRQHIKQRPKPDFAGALDGGGQKNARARGHAERRRMVFGQMIAGESRRARSARPAAGARSRKLPNGAPLRRDGRKFQIPARVLLRDEGRPRMRASLSGKPSTDRTAIGRNSNAKISSRLCGGDAGGVRRILGTGAGHRQDRFDHGLFRPVRRHRRADGQRHQAFVKQHGDTVAGKKIEIIRKDVGGIEPGRSPSVWRRNWSCATRSTFSPASR